MQKIKEKKRGRGRVFFFSSEKKTRSNSRSIAVLFLRLFLRPMRACSPTCAHIVLPGLSRTPPSAAIERASSSSSSSKNAGRRGLAFATMNASASASSTSPSQPPPPPPFDGSARRGGLLHPRFSDPSPTPPAGEAAPPVRAAQQRCSRCGGELSVSWLEGRWRHACVGGGGGSLVSASAAAPASISPANASRRGGGGGCGTIAYTNPLLVVGAIVTDVDDALSSSSPQRSSKKKPRVLLVKRAIEPRKGSWTLPAGYLELGESAAEGAARETWEEARARVEIFGPYFHAASDEFFFLLFFFFFFFFFLSVLGAEVDETQKKKKTFQNNIRYLPHRTSPRSDRPTSCSAASS